MRRESGFSLPGLLIGIAILAFMGVVTAQMFKTQAVSDAHGDLHLTHLSIARHLLNKMDCVATIAKLPDPAYCDADNKPVALYSKAAGNPVLFKSFSANQIQPWLLTDQSVPADALTEFGNFYVAAVCNASGEIKIFAKKVKGIPAEFKLIKPNIPWGCSLK